MKLRSTIIALVIVLTPFVIGAFLFTVKGSGAINEKVRFTTDTRENNKGVIYKGIKTDWTFCPDWEYKPLFSPPEEYLVFVFHYTNNNDHSVSVMPSYTFFSPPNKRYSANEEISMYIEDKLEDRLKIEDQTPIAFEISPNTAKNYIVTFEKPKELKRFYVDVDAFRDVTLRIHYEKENGVWINRENELIGKYKGRG